MDNLGDDNAIHLKPSGRFRKEFHSYNDDSKKLRMILEESDWFSRPVSEQPQSACR